MRHLRIGFLVMFVTVLLVGVCRLAGEAQSAGKARQLRQAVLNRYPQPQFHMNRYRIVPYKAKTFAVTTDGTVYAVWELLNGKWSWIFPFTSTQQQGSIDYAFREAGFSPVMQAKLGGSIATPVQYQRF